ncbi:hypothetical protein PVAND_010106 [Polypedilum vanderplanki]|uniref:Dystrophin n=1 Tax=Polypedilum vanderplanki TaxID=319348 RepID=A0A9J6CEU7_POLVA|nr:hypothetical protein PVAND_010106 [Polypedilum vanderplanki]
MSQQTQPETQGNELSFELLKNTQQIAEQAAIKAKEIAMRSSSQSKLPEIPIRGGSELTKAPEIPPKRLSLKKAIEENGSNNIDNSKPIPVPQRNQAQKPPPPIPQKPSSAQNSPRLKDKMAHPATTAVANLPQQMFHERVTQSPQLSAKNQNIVNILNSPLFQQRANQYKMQQQQQQLQNNTIRQQQQQQMMMKPDEDFGSEDALRGIERGLKNMERAMKEQMTLRNLDYVDGKNSEMQFNPMEFKRSLGGSFNSLDGQQQNIRMRLNFDGQAWGQRAIERNFSMDQMRLEALQGVPMKNIPVDFSQQPKHNIYRSLDRTLPLELQFSRHRQQQQQDQFEFMRQNNQIMNHRQPSTMSREDLNLRRRSSHDETQYIMQQQQQKQADNSGESGAFPIPKCESDLDMLRMCLKVTRLREQWDETSNCVMKRKSELVAMLGDSQRYESKRQEIEAWLMRMENRAERMAHAAAQTQTDALDFNVLDAQQKEQKTFHAELHTYKHHIELFNQLTQKLIAVYPADDTSRIKRMTESVNLRYKNLNNTVVTRGKVLHAAVNSVQSFDKSLDQFLAWLSEAESLCETAEALTSDGGEIDTKAIMNLKVSIKKAQKNGEQFSTKLIQVTNLKFQKIRLTYFDF